MKDFDLLGHRVRDVVTGFAGVVSTIAYDLYGCVQAIVTPAADDKGALAEGRWFDVKRLTVLDAHLGPVMPVPTFEYVAGPAEKSVPPTGPNR